MKGTRDLRIHSESRNAFRFDVFGVMTDPTAAEIEVRGIGILREDRCIVPSVINAS